MLIGPRAAGKSTLAPNLARALGWSCHDLDGGIVAATKQPIKALVDEQGWSAFRALEQEHLADALAHQDVVIATGAGAVEAAENQLMLQRTQAAVIWLDVDVETQLMRLTNDPSRPRLHPELSLRAELERLDQRRRPLYAACASISLDASGPAADLLSQCLRHLGASS